MTGCRCGSAVIMGNRFFRIAEGGLAAMGAGQAPRAVPLMPHRSLGATAGGAKTDIG